MATMSVREAMKLRRDYVCSKCYGEIAITSKGSEATVECYECKNKNFVTRKYAERKRAESAAELAEAKINLRPFIKTETRTANQNLKDMGF